MNITTNLTCLSPCSLEPLIDLGILIFGYRSMISPTGRAGVVTRCDVSAVGRAGVVTRRDVGAVGRGVGAVRRGVGAVGRGVGAVGRTGMAVCEIC